MRSQRRKQVLTLSILAVSVIALSVGFAAFSSVLRINTTAQVTPYSNAFSVKFSRTSDEVTCAKDNISENFYVVDSSNGNINMLSKYNLVASTTSPIQDPEDTTYQVAKNGVAFSSSNYWYSSGYIVDANYKNEGRSYPYVYNSSSSIYPYVEAYREVLEEMGVNVIDAKLLSYEQATKLGCVGRLSYSCASAPSWVYSSSYRLGSAYDVDSVWSVRSPGPFDYLDFDYGSVGVRPVITISESDIGVS